MSETTPFLCGVCLCDIEGVRASIDDTPVCMDCIESQIYPLFLKAIEHEFHYPVKWGGTTLHPRHFEDLGLSLDIIKRYERVEKEYLTPLADRVYCKNTILAEYRLPRGEEPEYGERLALWDLAGVEQAKKNKEGTVECGALLCTRRPYTESSLFLNATCWSCRGFACGTCGEPLYPSGPSGRQPIPQQHVCTWKAEQPEDIFRAKNSELKRGRDYQICPNEKCGNRVQLKDGCNHLRCPRHPAGWSSA